MNAAVGMINERSLGKEMDGRVKNVNNLAIT